MATPSRISLIPRIQAFSAQGVTLAYPERSWSGVREDDGAVVIGMREAEVQVSADGFRCLLWSPVIEGATEWLDRPIKQERLGHCRLAIARGGADGLVVCGARAEVEAGFVLALRVEKVGNEYWAFWGTLSECATGIAGRRCDPAFAVVERERLAA
ncbi:MAG TPA: hypothetical protein VD965_03120 [Burkholderiales bacterium]|nr:hypothetical protein [Burkholderiales bacterium]